MFSKVGITLKRKHEMKIESLGFFEKFIHIQNGSNKDCAGIFKNSLSKSPTEIGSK